MRLRGGAGRLAEDVDREEEAEMRRLEAGGAVYGAGIGGDYAGRDTVFGVGAASSAGAEEAELAPGSPRQSDEERAGGLFGSAVEELLRRPPVLAHVRPRVMTPAPECDDGTQEVEWFTVSVWNARGLRARAAEAFEEERLGRGRVHGTCRGSMTKLSWLREFLAGPEAPDVLGVFEVEGDIRDMRRLRRFARAVGYDLAFCAGEGGHRREGRATGSGANGVVAFVRRCSARTRATRLTRWRTRRRRTPVTQGLCRSRAGAQRTARWDSTAYSGTCTGPRRGTRAPMYA